MRKRHIVECDDYVFIHGDPYPRAPFHAFRNRAYQPWTTYKEVESYQQAFRLMRRLESQRATYTYCSGLGVRRQYRSYKLVTNGLARTIKHLHRRLWLRPGCRAPQYYH